LNGIVNLSNYLENEPNVVMDIIENHPFIPATFLLEDLAVKINKQNHNPQLNCVSDLALLFDACFDRVLEACIYNMDDLKRCIKVMPSTLDNILDAISSNEPIMQRILAASHTNTPNEILNELIETFPNHSELFIKYSQDDCHETSTLSP
jgi:hypothetical protein